MAENVGDAERLVVLLEARIRDFEKNMAKASGTATKSYGGMRRDSRTATQQMEADMNRTTGSINRAVAATSSKIGMLGKSMLAGFAGGLIAGGVAGVVSRIGQLASGVAAVGDEARRAGLSFKAFQELRYVADQNRISVGALTDGMKELALRADEFIVTGGGSAAEAFQRLGYGAEELNRKLQDPSALFTEIIGKLGDLDRAAQIRIADELFGGTGGEQFVQLIGQGEEGIRRTIQEANALGIVMDDQVIARAMEVDRKFNQIASTIGQNVQGALVDMLYPMLDFLKAQDEAIRRNRLLAMSADATTQYDGYVASIEGILDALDRVAPASAARIREISEEAMEGGISAKEAKEQLIGMATDPDLAPIIGDLNGLLGVLELLVGRTRTAKEELASLGGDRLDPVTGGGPALSWDNMQATFLPKPRTVPGSGGGSGSQNRAVEEADRQAKAIQNLIAGLEFERSLIGLSAIEQAKLNALRQAGASATEDQQLRISELVEANILEQQQIDYLTGMYDMLGQAGMGAVQGIIGAMQDGKIEAEEFGAILSDVLSMAGNFFLQQAFGGLGGGGGFNIMSLFQRRETGGPVQAGVPYIVGERRPEVFVPDQAGRILPRVPSPQQVASGEMNFNFNVNATVVANSEEEGAAGARGWQQGLEQWKQSGEAGRFVRNIVSGKGRY